GSLVLPGAADVLDPNGAPAARGKCDDDHPAHHPVLRVPAVLRPRGRADRAEGVSPQAAEAGKGGGYTHCAQHHDDARTSLDHGGSRSMKSTDNTGSARDQHHETTTHGAARPDAPDAP